ncbi:MAG: Heavy metal transport/detoxification protein [Candidatus Nomurabacteria bacterium GW2011_GWF1_34_20]|nr:MAG: Heavy metal transport/detoxification protein [Candidatus Nomurabacteria bacterium GW2011_GWF1_34_20]
MENGNNKYTFHVHGMHCNSCVLLTESEMNDLENVTHAKSNLKNNSIEIEGNFGDKTVEEIANELTLILKPHGYTLSLEKEIKDKKWSDFKIAIPIAFLFLAIFIILQKIGIVNLVNLSKVSYGTSFVVGIIASLSTCMAVVGGLVLSMSATFAKEGSVFTLNTSATFILGIIIGLVMLIMGINLLDIFSGAKKAQISMPKFISKKAFGLAKLNHTLTPLLVGIATFFLPCGFTQSMQVYTLSTGSFMNGALTMLAFALGTLPVLALVSFSSFSIKNNKNSGIFFKTAGIIVILFAIMNILNSLVIIGLIPPLLNF